MTADEIRPLIKRDKNFRPFRIVLNDGRTFDIKDPWLVLGAGDELMIGRPCPEPELWGVVDSVEALVTWEEVAKVEFLPPAVSPQGIRHGAPRSRPGEHVMTAEEIRPLIKRDESFRPFRITIDDGRTIDIRDPWLVLAVGDRFVIGLPMPENPTSGIADGRVTVTCDQVTKVEFLEPAVSA